MKSTSLILPLAAFAASVSIAQPAHLTDGLRLVEEINAAHAVGVFADNQGVKVNRYGGAWKHASDPSFIRFLDEANGVLPANNTTCAPLVTHLLKHSYNWNWSAFSFIDPLNGKSVKSASPNPPRYNALIKQQVGFAAQITNATEALPGDVISMHQLGTSQGHTVILVALDWQNPLPYPESGTNWNPALANTTFVRMTVLDSTASPHSNDSRRFELVDEETDIVTAYEITGAGTGDMGLFIDANGHVVAHTWSLPNSDYETQPEGWMGGINSRLYLQNQRELVIGRLP